MGSCPALENIATLIDPPGSKLSEPQWVSQILQESNGEMLLDLHNLYSNAINFGFDPIACMLSFPLDLVRFVHLSGGQMIQEPLGYKSRTFGKRMLDDHIHDVPDAVFALLGLLAETVDQPLTVILERDGNFPDFKILLNQLDRAKMILKNARLARQRKSIEQSLRESEQRQSTHEQVTQQGGGVHVLAGF